MKKGLCIVLSALMIALSFAACGNKKDISDEPTKVDANGSAYVEVTDKDGNEVTSVLSDKDKAKADKKAAKDNKETTTVNASELVSQAENIANGISKIDEKDLKSDKKDLISTGTETKKTSLRDDVIIKTTKSGKFTLKATIKASSGENTDITCSVNDKAFAYSASLNGVSTKVIIENNSFIIAFPDYKWYYKTTSEDIGFGSIDDIMSGISNEENKYVGSTKVKVDGAEYTCEEYKNSDGMVTKYYFDKNNNWKRIESIDGDVITIMEINSFTNKVDSSIFSVKGYTDITPLIGQLDASSFMTTKKS